MTMRVPIALILMVIFSSTSGAEDDPRRSLLEPSKAIAGHWVSESGRTHYYFADGKLIMVDDGTPAKMTFKILKEDKDELLLRLKITTELGGSHEKTLRFSSTRKGLLETVAVDVKDKKVHVSTIWKYVDDKTEPKE